MKPRPLDPLALDVAALCRSNGSLAGHWPQAGMVRLLGSPHTDAAAAPPPVHWHVVGSLRVARGRPPQEELVLRLRTEVQSSCQRCLQPLAHALEVERRFVFVATEEEAAAADADNDAEEVLVLAPRLDLHELAEDELILAMPLVPVHAACPQPLLAPAEALADDDAAPHPFAALASLRRSGGGLA